MTSAIPSGSVATFTDIGGHIDVMPRHIAYILRMLDPVARETVPWHRVVSADGSLLAALLDEQAARLADEGVIVAKGKVTDLKHYQVTIADLSHGIAARSRPPDAPVTKTRKRR